MRRHTWLENKNRTSAAAQPPNALDERQPCVWRGRHSIEQIFGSESQTVGSMTDTKCISIAGITLNQPLYQVDITLVCVCSWWGLRFNANRCWCIRAVLCYICHSPQKHTHVCVISWHTILLFVLIHPITTWAFSSSGDLLSGQCRCLGQRNSNEIHQLQHNLKVLIANWLSVIKLQVCEPSPMCGR